MSGFDSSDEESNAGEQIVEPFKMYWVDLSVVGCPNSVAVCELPGCKFKNNWRNLDVDLGAIKDYGFSHVYCLCSRGELTKYRVPKLLTEYHDQGLNVHHYPFLDGTAPDISQLMLILEDIKNVLENGDKLFIHCFGGLGRSCLVVACLLMHYDDNMTTSEVIEIVQKLRGPGAIQTIKQYNFVQDFRNLRDDYEAKKVGISQRAISR